MRPLAQPNKRRCDDSFTANVVRVSSSIFSKSFMDRRQRGTPFSSKLSSSQSFKVAFPMEKESCIFGLM